MKFDLVDVIEEGNHKEYLTISSNESEGFSSKEFKKLLGNIYLFYDETDFKKIRHVLTPWFKERDQQIHLMRSSPYLEWIAESNIARMKHRKIPPSPFSHGWV